LIAGILKEAGSCRDLQRLGQNKSGLYQIYVERLAERFSLYCDQETDGGGWLVRTYVFSEFWTVYIRAKKCT